MASIIDPKQRKSSQPSRMPDHGSITVGRAGYIRNERVAKSEVVGVIYTVLNRVNTYSIQHEGAKAIDTTMLARLPSYRTFRSLETNV